jgi:DNA-binding SARP family transcriptional activator/tetratricopeptide (TPR) repeat protein
MARLSLTLLGGFQARLDPGPALSLPTRKSQALLAYLALPLGRAHPRDTLAALLWGGTRETSARASLRQALFAIRRALAPVEGDVLRQNSDTLALVADAVDVDVAAFECFVADGDPETLERAAALYRGDLLSGFALDEAPFEDWLLLERERLRELAVEGLAKLLAHHRRGGASDAAIATALRLLTLDSLQEPIHRTLMRLYAEQGRRGTALRQYQHCVAVLQRELGVEPETETQQLYQEILRRRRLRAATVEPISTTVVTSRTRIAEMALIGRAAELDRLRGLLGQAGAGRGGTTAILGEAGIGKTRLVNEVIEIADEQGARVLIGRSYESEQVLPFGPWVDALRAARLDAETLRTLAPSLRADLARLLPEIGHDPAPSRSDPGDVRPLFESVTQVLGQLAQRSPVLVVLEDLHWADEMTARLLVFASRRLHDRSVMVVFTAREDELTDAPALRQALNDLQRDGGLTTVVLPALSRTDTLRLVHRLARSGDEVTIERLGEHAWAVGEGNPFVTVETVRAHTDGTLLAHGPGLGVPERVREIVARRLDRLSSESHGLAAVAAVIGREFEFHLLQRAAGLDEERTASAVEELVRRGVLQGVDERFDFTHDRIRQVVHDRILPPRRKLVHRKVAEAIEELHAGRVADHHLALGLHYRGAEVWDHAARHLYSAGDTARARAANRESVACFDAAIDCLERLSATPERSAQIVDAIINQETALMALGEFQRSLTQLARAERLARDLGDRSRLGRIFGRVAYHLASLGDFDGSLANAAQAQSIAVESGNIRGRVSSNIVLARAWYARGAYREALVAMLDNEALATEEMPEAMRINVAFSRVWSVLILAELGRFREAFLRGDDLLARPTFEFGRHGEVWVHLGVGRLCLVKGDHARAIAILEHALPLCESGGDLAAYFSRIATSLGGAYVLAGRLPEALTLLERADAHDASIAFAYGHPLVLATLAEARLRAGNVERAGADADRGLALGRANGQRGWEAWGLRIRGEIALRHEPSDVVSAERCFREAAALAAERDMRPLLAHCHFGLGRLYQATGKHPDAREHVAAAAILYRDMGMTYWLDRLETDRSPAAEATDAAGTGR